MNGTLFFQATDGVHGNELWRSNGTAAGTQMVKDINPGPNGSYPYDLTGVNGTLFFVVVDGTTNLNCAPFLEERASLRIPSYS